MHIEKISFAIKLNGWFIVNYLSMDYLFDSFNTLKYEICRHRTDVSWGWKMDKESFELNWMWKESFISSAFDLSIQKVLKWTFLTQTWLRWKKGEVGNKKKILWELLNISSRKELTLHKESEAVATQSFPWLYAPPLNFL